MHVPSTAGYIKEIHINTYSGVKTLHALMENSLRFRNAGGKEAKRTFPVRSGR